MHFNSWHFHQMLTSWLCCTHWTLLFTMLWNDYDPLVVSPWFVTWSPLASEQYLGKFRLQRKNVKCVKLKCAPAISCGCPVCLLMVTVTLASPNMTGPGHFNSLSLMSPRPLLKGEYHAKPKYRWKSLASMWTPSILALILPYLLFFPQRVNLLPHITTNQTS